MRAWAIGPSAERQDALGARMLTERARRRDNAEWMRMRECRGGEAEGQQQRTH